jgi:hypothetical protein
MGQYIIALIGTVTAVVSVTLTNYFNKKNLLKLEERKIKQEYYIQFLKTLSDSMNLDFENKQNHPSSGERKPSPKW